MHDASSPSALATPLAVVHGLMDTAERNKMEESDAESKSEFVTNFEAMIAELANGERHHDFVPFLHRLLTPAVCKRLGLYRYPDSFLLSVVIPIYNEVQTLRAVVRRVRETDVPCELILVDDGSTDGTKEILRELDGQDDTIVVFHEENRGKGAAIRTGLAQSRGEVVVIQDADLEYDPHEFPLLLLPILDGAADVVYGSRFSSQNRRVPKYWHSTINRLLTLLSNMKTNLKLTDVETCYKLVRRDVLRKVLPSLRENGFGIEIELTAKLAKLPGIRFHEIPISYAPRTHEEGKKIGVRDGLWALWCILKY